jgi:hypothetical protein
MKISKVPVITLFSIPYKYENEPIEEYNIYIVEMMVRNAIFN